MVGGLLIPDSVSFENKNLSQNFIVVEHFRIQKGWQGWFWKFWSCKHIGVGPWDDVIDAEDLFEKASWSETDDSKGQAFRVKF